MGLCESASALADVKHLGSVVAVEDEQKVVWRLKNGAGLLQLIAVRSC